MLRAAKEYVIAGWPIGAAWLPGKSQLPHSWDGARIRRPPGAKVIATEGQLMTLWGPNAPARFGIVLVCGRGIDAWAVPAAVGARALDLLGDDVECAVPVAVTPFRTWYFFTTTVPLGDRTITHPLLPVRHFGQGSVVPLPPTHRSPAGPDLWLNPCAEPREPAPWKPVCDGLAKAALAELDEAEPDNTDSDGNAH
jgi:hypothetical protein